MRQFINSPNKLLDQQTKILDANRIWFECSIAITRTLATALKVFLYFLPIRKIAESIKSDIIIDLHFKNSTFAHLKYFH